MLKKTLVTVLAALIGSLSFASAASLAKPNVKSPVAQLSGTKEYGE